VSARVTAGAAAPDPAAAERVPMPRPAGLTLARVHLRLGSLALARAELEVLGGEGGLDGPAQVDLAEARWRTGDLAAAGTAATAALEAGEDGAMLLAIAAEAAAALGRPNEARRLATRAMELVGGPVDALFAGMPRSGVWPADADEPPPTAATLFHQEPARTVSLRAGDTDPGVIAARASAGDGHSIAGEGTSASSNSAGSALTVTLGFWDGDGDGAAPRNDLPDPARELDAGRAALVAGSIDEAALRLALALRLAPALAPAILEATDGMGSPGISVIRGDAYREVGLETEARRAYAAAAWSGSRDRRGRTARPRATVAIASASPAAAPVPEGPETETPVDPSSTDG
jgi:tetratricopeptide (TPR) repeat protein